MIDTIHCYLNTATPVDMIHIVDDEEIRRMGKVVGYKGKLKNIQLEYFYSRISDYNYLRLRGSLAKYYYGTNLKSFPDAITVGKAIQQLEDELGVPIGRSYLTRLDIGLNVPLPHPSVEYARRIYKKAYAKPKIYWAEHQTIYIGNKTVMTSVYDKLAETNGDLQLPTKFKGKYVLRIEHRINGSDSIKNKLRMSQKPMLKHLSNPSIYGSCISFFNQEFDKLKWKKTDEKYSFNSYRLKDIMKEKFVRTLINPKVVENVLTQLEVGYRTDKIDRHLYFEDKKQLGQLLELADRSPKNKVKYMKQLEERVSVDMKYKESLNYLQQLEKEDVDKKYKESLNYLKQLEKEDFFEQLEKEDVEDI